MLSSAAQVFFSAAQAGKTVIDGEAVNAALDNTAVIETTDVSDGIEGAL